MNFFVHDLRGLIKFLYLQRVKGFSPPGDEPFMPAAEVARFKEEIGRAKHYVEFGSGGSTVYASRFGNQTISVENDRFYARAVATRLNGKSVTQVVADMGITREWGMPLFPSAVKARRYVMAPWDAECFPDFILVDGRYRVACALESARRARARNATAIMMFDDYSERPFYHIVEEFLGQPEIVGRAAIFEIGTQIVPPNVVAKWLKDPA
jgi:hypothetical protein